jgi:hypothetical protein
MSLRLRLPSQLRALEAIPELLEQLHGREPGLVGELLAELA